MLSFAVNVVVIARVNEEVSEFVGDVASEDVNNEVSDYIPTRRTAATTERYSPPVPTTQVNAWIICLREQSLLVGIIAWIEVRLAVSAATDTPKLPLARSFHGFKYS